MSDSFRIYVDRLREGGNENILEKEAPDFMEVVEEDVFFEEEIKLEGRAYLATDDLVMNLKISTTVRLLCRICNEFFQYPIVIEDFFHMVPKEEMKGMVFNFRSLVREALLLEVPSYSECSDGTCPVRTDIEKFLVNKKTKDSRESHSPFENL